MSVNQLLIIALALIVGFIALAVLAAIVYLVYRAVNQVSGGMKGFASAVSTFCAAADRFSASLEKLSPVIDKMAERTSAATEGHSKVAGAILLEYHKLRIAIEKFSGLVMKPDLTEDNMPKFGLQTPSDTDISRQFDIEQLVEKGVPRDEAEAKVNADLDLNSQFNLGM